MAHDWKVFSNQDNWDSSKRTVYHCNKCHMYELFTTGENPDSEKRYMTYVGNKDPFFASCEEIMVSRTIEE